MERRLLALWHLAHLAEHLARRRLVEAAAQIALADRVEEAKSADGHDICRVLGDVEADANVALRAEVVDLVGLDRAHQLVEHGAVPEIAVEELDLAVEMIDARAVERARTAHHAVHVVALLEQDLGEIRSVLTGDAGDERLALHQRTRGGAGSPWASCHPMIGLISFSTKSCKWGAKSS